MGKCFSKPAYPLEICRLYKTESAVHPYAPSIFFRALQALLRMLTL